MAVYHYTTTDGGDDNRPNAPPRSRIPLPDCFVAGTGALLLAVTGLGFLLVASPLLLLLSPVLLFGGFVLAGFGSAGAAALVGLWSLKWAFRNSVGGSRGGGGVRRVGETVTESRQRVKEEVADFGGGYSHRRVVVLPP